MVRAAGVFLLVGLLAPQRAQAGLDWGDIVEPVKDVGRELERTWDKTEAEYKRFEDRVQAEGQRIGDDLSQAVKDLGDISSKIADELKILDHVATKTKKLFVEVKREVDDVKEEADTLHDQLGTIKKVLDSGYGDIAPVGRAAGSLLGPKLDEALRTGKLNEFLDSELAGDLRVIDVLLPLEAGFERVDPTGVQDCIRRLSAAGGPDGAASLALPPQLVGGRIVTQCVLDNAPQRTPDPSEPNYEQNRSEYEARIAAQEQANAVKRSELEKQLEDKQRLEAYESEIAKNKAIVQDAAIQLAALVERASKAKTELQNVSDEMANLQPTFGL